MVRVLSFIPPEKLVFFSVWLALTLAGGVLIVWAWTRLVPRWTASRRPNRP